MKELAAGEEGRAYASDSVESEAELRQVLVDVANGGAGAASASAALAADHSDARDGAEHQTAADSVASGQNLHRVRQWPGHVVVPEEHAGAGPR